MENKTTLKDVWLILLQTKCHRNIIIVEAWALIKNRNIKNKPSGYKNYLNSPHKVIWYKYQKHYTSEGN